MARKHDQATIDKAYREARLLLLLPPERQRQAVRLAGQGLKNSEIAQRMDVSISAVVAYLDRAYKFMGVSTRMEAYERLMALENEDVAPMDMHTALQTVHDVAAKY